MKFALKGMPDGICTRFCDAWKLGLILSRRGVLSGEIFGEVAGNGGFWEADRKMGHIYMVR